MKTITINLTPEQEKIFLARLNKASYKVTSKEHTLLTANFKNPSEDTKSRLNSAKKSLAKLEKEWELADGFLKQIEEQLNKEAA